MSSPSIMRTGFGLITRENCLPETFYVIYLILGAILRRCGLKDCIFYAKHNKADFNQHMFDSGVLFNLYSEYGVGKSLEPLIYELFSTATLDSEKNERNVFFREIVRLIPFVTDIIRLKNPSYETEWMLEYSMMMEAAFDDIANERILRLSDLLFFGSDSDSDTDNDQYEMSLSDDYSDDSDNSEILPGGEIELCYCLYCNEFRKYHNNFYDRDVSGLINETLIEITKKINK